MTYCALPSSQRPSEGGNPRGSKQQHGLLISIVHSVVAQTILLFATRDNSDRVIGKRSLQFERLRRVGQEPQVDFCRRRQDNRHRLRMDWRDDGVWFRCEETEKLMLPIDGRALRPSNAAPRGP
jgi:hypothetical protein